MTTNNNKNFDEQEIDLTRISNGIGGFLTRVNRSIFKGIQFVLKHIVIIGILFIVGVSLGFYLDKTQKIYDNQIIVAPNFGSTDYLYSKIELIESKIKENDTIFFKSIGVQEPTKLIKIQVEPIVDIYKFINSNSEQNFELLKLMAEDGDMKKIVLEKATSKNYTYHVISFKTKKKTSRANTIEPLLKFLNSTDFYTRIQKVQVSNMILKMKANDTIIAQIDGFLNSFSNRVNGNTKNDKLVYYNENTQLNDVIQTKNKLISEQASLRIELVSIDKIIKESSSTINLESFESVSGKLKFILPFLLIMFYIFIHRFSAFYKKQSSKKSQI